MVGTDVMKYCANSERVIRSAFFYRLLATLKRTLHSVREQVRENSQQPRSSSEGYPKIGGFDELPASVSR